MLLLVSFLVFTGGTSAQERLGLARESLLKGDLARAEEIADEVLGEVDDTTDEWFEASNLKHRVEQLRKNGPTESRGTRAAQKIESRMEGFFAAASPFFRDEDYARGLEELVKLTAFLGSDEYRALRRDAGDATVREMEEEYRNSVKSILQSWADQMESVSGPARGRLTAIEELKIQAGDPEQAVEVMTEAKAIRDLVAPEQRRRTLESAESIEIALGMAEDRLAPRLRKASDVLDQVHDKAFRVYHRTRALVRRREVRAQFEATMSEVADLKNGGRLDAAMTSCRDFLLVCNNLRAEQPEEFYAPVVADLFGPDALNLNGKVKAELDRLTTVRTSLDRAETLVAEGKYAEANDLFRETLRQNSLIDFGDLIRLCADVHTRPVGAKVTMRWHDEEPKVLGATGPDGLLVRYPPYGETVIEATRETFEPARLRIEDYNDEHDAAPLLELTKIPEWTWAGAGPIQSSPEVWATALLVASRDGHLRAFERRTGALRFDLDTKMLSGFTARPVIRGSTAYLSSLDGRLLAVDLEEQEVLFTVETAERLRTAPLVIGDLLVVADEGGTVYGIRAGEILWRRTLTGRVQGDPVAVGDDVIVGTTEGHLVSLSTADGEVAWDVVPGGRIYASLVSDDAGRVYVGTDASEVLCVAVADGAVLWRAETDNAVRGRPLVRDAGVYVSTLAGTVYRLSRETGEVRGRVSVPDERGIEGGVSFGRENLYFVDAGGILHAFDPARGEEWSYTVGAGAVAAPRVQDGRVYVATGAGAVYCFRE